MLKTEEKVKNMSLMKPTCGTFCNWPKGGL